MAVLTDRLKKAFKDDNGITNLPNTYAFQVTSLCDFSCGHCYQSGSLSESMSPEELKNILVGLKREDKFFTKKVVSVSGGEIFAHPKYVELFKVFAEENVPVNLITNGGFAERRLLKSNSIDDKVLAMVSEILVNGIVNSTQASIFDKMLKRNVHASLKNGSSLFHSYTPELIQSINEHIVALDFYKGIKEINFSMPRFGKPNVIKGIRVSLDGYHLTQRALLGYTPKSIFTEFFTSLKARLDRDFSDIILQESRKTMVANTGDAKQGVFDRERMTDLYNQNYAPVLNSGGNREKLNSLLSIAACLDDGTMNISPDGFRHACGYGILPSMTHSDFPAIQSAFRKAGPIGIARLYGVSESVIKEVFTDLGPCGLCTYVMNNKL